MAGDDDDDQYDTIR